MRQPVAFAQPHSVSGQEPHAFSSQEPNSGGEPNAVSLKQSDALPGRQPDANPVGKPNSDSKPESVADQVALARSRPGQRGPYPASCQRRRSPFGSTMSATGIATSQWGAPTALTRISMTSESRRWATPAQSFRKANTTGRTRFST